jgi:ferredoxin-type protein NapF
MPSRREFLALRPRAALARVQPSCLESSGVVCRACRDACDERAIAFQARPAPPLIDPSRCTGCGACAKVCPASAIAVASP